jgi:hypothetical protein
MATPAVAIINMVDSQNRPARMKLHVPVSTTILALQTFAGTLAAVSQLGITSVAVEQVSNSLTTAPAATPDAYGEAGFHAALEFSVVGAPGSHIRVDVPGPFTTEILGDNETITIAESLTGGPFNVFMAALVTLGVVSVGGEALGTFTGGRLIFKHRKH